MSEDRPLVDAVDVHKSFGDVHVLRGFSASVPAGSVSVLIGPSGSGKTTALRCLDALEVPERGTVRIGDVEVDYGAGPDQRLLRRLRAQSGMVFQAHHLFPHMTAAENVMAGPALAQGVPREQARTAALGLLERVGLGGRGDALPSQLSGGQQQRVGIARALAVRPAVVLFDEPTSALDPELVGEVLAVMRDLAQQGTTMVVVTHEIRFAQQVADQVLFLDGGVVLERGSAEEVLTAPRQERTRQFLRRIVEPL